MTRWSRRRTVPRRALIEDVGTDPSGWLQHGIGAVAVTVLGFGVAASVALTGNATSTSSGTPASVAPPRVTRTVTPGVRQPEVFSRPEPTTGRASSRPALSPAVLAGLSRNRSSALSQAGAAAQVAARKAAVTRRDKALTATSTSTRKKAKSLRAEARRKAAEGGGAGASGGKSCLPLSSYTVAARFGDVGSWARYHTGFDFSAPIGTPIHAPSAGVVTNAGPGSASGWAGNYVTIEYPNGTQSLMAHMSRVTVHVGEKVRGCQVVGAVGTTGRAFGPHVHFEIYPAGVEPGDIYRAVNPERWLDRLGLRP